MFIYDLDNNFTLHSNDLSLTPELQIKFNKILINNYIPKKEFIESNKNGIVYLNSSSFLLCQLRDLAGLRLTTLNDSDFDYNNLNEGLHLKLESVSSQIGADLIQLLIPINKMKNLSLKKNFLIENFVFEKNTSIESPTNSINFSKLNLSNPTLLKKLAELEYIQRIQFPSTTFRPKDTYSIIANEYIDLPTIKGIDGLCIEGDPLKGFIIWWENERNKQSICVFVWVSEKLRGKSYGTSLLNQMSISLKAMNIEKSRSFISATNISSIKSHLKSSFELTYVSLNYFPSCGKRSSI